jgi:hypothetical protein
MAKYDPTFHPERLLELMSKGLLDCEIYSCFDVSDTTFRRWRKDYPEFNEAYEKGLPKVESELVIKPLRKMIEEGHDKGYKPLAHIARNKFGHDQTSAQTVNNTQINIKQMNVLQSKEDYDQLEAQVKEQLADLNIIDTNYIELKPNDESI